MKQREYHNENRDKILLRKKEYNRKNKEKIDIIDEEDMLNKIKSLNTGEKSEFDDLLEIGGE